MARIENHKYSIEEAFRECFYVVPDYQREYVWTDKEVIQLLDDINEQVGVESSKEYFIGTVLVSPSDQKNHYEVIDGQQRLTTCFLLLCALKNRFQGESQHQALGSLISTSYTDGQGETRTSLKLEPRYENAGEVVATLVKLDASPADVRSGIQGAGIRTFGSIENLVNAYATIHAYLQDNYTSVAQLKRYWGYLANNVVFIQISADISSALKIFETINERGVGLNPMDLLKNLLFTQVQPADFTRLKDEWKKITKPLERDREKPLRFLRYFLMANYVIKNDRNDATIQEDEIYDWFTRKENAATTDYSAKPFEFVRKVTRNVESYLWFAHGFGNNGAPSVAVSNLRKLTGGAFSLHNVVLLAAAPLPTELFEHFVVQLESFLFYFIFTKSPTKELEKLFSNWADELRTIAGTMEGANQRAALNGFVAERFETTMASKAKELVDDLNRLSLNTMQQYRIRYFLARLTQHVDMAFNGNDLRASLDPYTNLQIEHILPDSPAPSLRSTWDRENPTAPYWEFKVRIGNLTLLEKPHNIVAGNDFYSAKVGEYRKSSNYLTRSLVELTGVGQDTSVTRINEKLRSFSDWNKDSIEARHQMLVSLAQDVWRTRPIG